MRAILFVDLLGARKLWQSGGVTASKRAFDNFTSMVVAAAREEAVGSVVGGGVETDAAMLVCLSAEVALSIAKRLYMRAFEQPTTTGAPRLWLRGSIVAHNDTEPLRRETALRPPLERVSVYPYAPSALDAVSIEKGGFRGMRILLREEIATAGLKRAMRIPVHGSSFVPLRKLKHSGYPKSVEGELLDYLWMATEDDQSWRALSMKMTQRLRHSNSDADEFAQAAATQVIFHEYAALRQSVQSRALRASQRNKAVP